MTTPDLTIEIVPIGDLTPDSENARLHGDENLDSIRRSLSRFGQIKPLVVHDGVVIAGNGTLQAAKELGWEQISIIRVPTSWDRPRAQAYAIADNRTAELAEWDSEVLSSQLVDLDAAGWDLQDLGFPEIPLRDTSESEGGRATPDAGLSDNLIRCPKCGFTWEADK